MDKFRRPIAPKKRNFAGVTALAVGPFILFIRGEPFDRARDKPDDP